MLKSIKEAKTYLSRYKYKLKECNRLKLKIADLQRLANGNAGMNFEKNEGHPSVPKQMKDFVNEINDLELEYKKLLAESEKICLEIEKAIYNVAIENALYANILAYYYDHGFKLMDIALEFNYSYAQIYRFYLAALKLFIKYNPELEI